MSRPYSDSESAFILQAYARGASLSDIADTLGRTPHSVSQRHQLLQRKARIRARSLTGSAEG